MVPASAIRKAITDAVDIIMAGGGGHISGDMSVLDALLVLYKNHLRVTPATQDDPGRDRFVLSKGHAMEAYYAALAACGFLELEDVKARFSKFGSPYIGHPNNKLAGIEMNSGSLGHGLPVCVGMALAGKMDKRDYRVYTILGDGELAEGSVWEGAMAAARTVPTASSSTHRAGSATTCARSGPIRWPSAGPRRQRPAFPRPALAAFAISNQRETTAAWDKATGEPVCDAIVWQCARAAALCEQHESIAQDVLHRTGMNLSPYGWRTQAA